MNRGHVLQSSPVQQMMATGGPTNNWWNINNMRPPLPSSSSSHLHHHQPSSSPFLAVVPHHPHLFPQFPPQPNPSSWLVDNQDQLPESWSQLLLGGLVGEEAAKKLENWEEQLLSQQSHQNGNSPNMVDIVKQETSPPNSGGYAAAPTAAFCHQGNMEEFMAQQATNKPTWSPVMNNNMAQAISSPKSSCVTSLSSNMLDFSSNNNNKSDSRHPPPDRSSECNSTATGGAAKKAKIQPSSTQSTFKVRKEKLGDRITSLHQLVSPFGKTDTASVLLEAIGYIRFLQSQIEALSLPYFGNGSGNMRHQQQSGQGEMNCLFPEDPGQLLNDNCMKRKGASDHQDSNEEPKKDLRSRGLCLVPVSCTMQVGSDNGADYWAPALNGGFR